MKPINVLDARRLIDEEPDLTVIETLPEEYFDESHLPGAKNIPLDDQFEEQVQMIAPDMHKPVLVYSLDAKSKTSHKAASRLERIGYDNVYDFVGGKIEWQENGLPLE